MVVVAVFCGCPTPPSQPDGGAGDAGPSDTDAGITDAGPADAGALLPPVDPPGAPTGLTAQVSGQQVQLTWTAAPGATAHDVHFAAAPGVALDSAGALRGVTAPATVTRQPPGTTWHYVVSGTNRGGRGPASNEVAVTLPALSAPAAPRNLTAAAGDGEVSLGWEAVPDAGSYRVYAAPTAGVSAASAAPLTVSGTTWVHAGRANGSTWHYRVSAVAAGVEGALSAEVSATPRAGPLGAPTSLLAIAEAGRVSVWWPPQRGALTYRLYWARTAGVTPATGTRVDVTDAPYVHAGLPNGVRHYYVLTSLTDAGESAPSAESSAVPDAEAPRDLAADAGVGRVTVSYVPSFRPGTTGQNLYWSTSPGVVPSAANRIALSGASPFVHTGVTNGTTHYYVATSTSDGGESAPSLEVSATPRRAAPSSPAITAAVGSLVLGWTPGVGEVGFHLDYALALPDGGFPAQTSRLANVTPPYTHQGLTNGRAVRYRLVSLGAAGDESFPSDEAVGTPRISAPQSVVATPGDGQVTLTWDPVPGAASYDVYWEDSSFVDEQIGTLVANVTSPWLHGGLTNGQTYAYVVVAREAGGAASVASAIATAVPRADAPSDAPTNVIAQAGPARVTLSWTGVPDAGFYNVYVSTTPGVTPDAGTKLPYVSSPFTHAPLLAGQTYFYVVTAFGEGGEGPPSAQVSAAVPVTALTAPSGLSVATEPRRVRLTWSAVPGAYAYQVHGGPGPGVATDGGALLATVTTTTFIEAPLAPGATRTFAVTAHNGAAASPPSAEASGAAGPEQRDLSAGEAFTLALKPDGSLWSFGRNDFAQLGVGPASTAPTPAAVRVLRPDAGLVSGALQVATGTQHGLALEGDGTVLAWGRNTAGATGQGTSGVNTLRAQPVLQAAATPLTGVVALAGGAQFSVALTADGGAWSFGANGDGQLATGTQTARAFAGPMLTAPATPFTRGWRVSAGFAHVLVLRDDGTVWAAGLNANGQLGDGTTLSAPYLQPVRLDGGAPLGDVVDVEAGHFHSHALKRDGTLVAWGANANAELGVGDFDERWHPTPVELAGHVPLQDVFAIGSYFHSVVSLANGDVWSFGTNVNAVLADNFVIESALLPQRALGATLMPFGGARSVAAGNYASVVWTSGGLFGAGNNEYGQLGMPLATETCFRACSRVFRPGSSF